MGNPFYFRELPLSAPFCNREKELKELSSHAINHANVVLFSPRRFGKTSLVKRVQKRLGEEGFVALHVDFFGVTSVEDVAARIASRLYHYSQKDEGLFKKIMRFLSSLRPVIRPDPEYGISISVEYAPGKKGLELLDEVLSGIGHLMDDQRCSFNIVFDEFQETSGLSESLQIEGIMRTHIQAHSSASYFFVGSRRRVLKEIFNDRKRPFYMSAINYPLPPLPVDDAAEFIVEQFKLGGKACPEEIAKRIAHRVGGYPYYVQRIPYSIFEIAGEEVSEDDYIGGFAMAIEEERPVYEAMLQAIAPKQIKLLTALAEEPTDKPYSAGYMAKHNLGSIGGVQGAIKRLIDLDYIEHKDNILHLVDPVFGTWLRHLKTGI